MTSVGPFGTLFARFLAEFEPLVADAREALCRLEALDLAGGQACRLHVEQAIEKLEQLRGALAEEAERSAIPAVPWTNRTELSSAVGQMDEALEAAASAANELSALRRRLEGIAAILREGAILEDDEEYRQAAERTRDGALEQLCALLASDLPGDLPGPIAPDEWFGWVFSLTPKHSDLARIKELAPKLESFVRRVGAANWRPPQRAATDASLDAPLARERPPEVAPVPVESPPLPSTTEVVPGRAAAESAWVIAESVPSVAFVPEAVSSSSEFIFPPPFETAVSTASSSAPSAEAAAPVLADVAPRETTGAGGLGPGPLTAAPPPVVPLETFDAWVARRHVAEDGRVEVAPWADAAAFCARQVDRQRRALVERNLASLWIHARAAEDVGCSAGVPLASRNLVDSRDVADLAACLEAGAIVATSRSQERSARLALAAQGGGEGSSESLRFALLCAAVAPFVEGLPVGPELDDLLEIADFSDDDLRRVIGGMLRGAQQGEDGLRLLARAVASKGERIGQDLEQAYDDQRAKLERLVDAYKLDFGGNHNFDHCRKAWRVWVDAYADLFRQLAQDWRRGPPDLSAIRRRLETMVERAEQIFDRQGALHEARKRMKRIVGEIHQVSLGILAAWSRYDESVRSELRGHNEVDEEAAGRLLDAFKGTDGSEEGALRALLLAAIGRARPGRLALTGRDLLARPLLLGALPRLDEKLPRDPDASIARVDQLDVRLAAHLMDGATLMVSDEEWPASLLTAVERRPDLRTRLHASLPPEIADQDRTRLADAQERAWTALGQLEQAALELADLAPAQSGEVRRVLDDARARVSSEATVPLTSVPLLAWLQDAVGAVQSRVSACVLALRAQAAGDDRALEAIDHRQFDAALRLLRGEDPGERRRSVRETPWRANARDELRGPVVAAIDELPSQRSELNELVRQWRQQRDQAGRRPAYRKLFAEAVFGKALTGPEVAENSEQCFDVPTAAVRKAFRAKKLTPTFLRWPASFTKVRLLTPPEQTTKAAFAQRAADLAGNLSQHALTVLLAPGVPEASRDEFKRLCAERHLTVAILDDLDFCRLFRPVAGRVPDPLVGLLELFLEQQDWATFTPFQAPRGEAMDVEMYVGRAGEAQKLATESYSRLFSGRKLGKSALLRYAEDTLDGVHLQSGNRLRIVYVMIAGIADERVVTREILGELKRRLQFVPRSTAVGVEPGLDEALRQFIDERVDESLLIVLDEADRFVETQVEEYNRRREEVLSFRMRALESICDDERHPRVRFVFSGYRQTDTNEGAWRGNWGQVLRLSPLRPEDAIKLVEAPLARLGIDASAQAAAIAWRCGYQPAVILKFGQVLLEKLRRRAGQSRRAVVVKRSDVAEVFDDQSVREEIQTIIRSNFQGSDWEWVVFRALLFEFGALGPGEWLSHAAQRIAERLLGVVEAKDLPWGESRIAARIDDLLGDFVLRELVMRRRLDEGDEYAMKFPHHLQLFRTENAEDQLYEAVVAAKDSAPATDGPTAPLPMLGPKGLEAVRTALDGPVGEAELVVVASMWSAPFGGHWLTDALGLPASSLVETAVLEARYQQPKLVAINVSVRQASSLLERRKRMDLPPPVCVGGVDLVRWALDQGRGEARRRIVVVGTGRVDGPFLQSWFKNAREHAVAPDDVRLIDERTNGIPMLVGELDHALGVAQPIVREGLLNALARLEARYPDLRNEFLRGPATHRLDQREQELLDAALALASHNCGRLTSSREDWDFVQEYLPRTTTGLLTRKPIHGIAAPNEADAPSLELLELLGLLPSEESAQPASSFERLRMLMDQDALFVLCGRARQP